MFSKICFGIEMTIHADIDQCLARHTITTSRLTHTTNMLYNETDQSLEDYAFRELTNSYHCIWVELEALERHVELFS